MRIKGLKGQKGKSDQTSIPMAASSLGAVRCAKRRVACSQCCDYAPAKALASAQKKNGKNC